MDSGKHSVFDVQIVTPMYKTQLSSAFYFYGSDQIMPEYSLLIIFLLDVSLESFRPAPGH